MNKRKNQSEGKSESVDLEELLREKEKLDSIIKRKFTKKITMMFTDLTGSTRMSELLGDLAMRAILRNHNDIVFPIIKSNNGHLVKTMGDGTMSYFVDVVDAIKAAMQIQLGIEKYNSGMCETPLLIRCGLNTGLGLVEEKDVHGDVVNVAQRFEALAEPREILMSHDTYKLATENKDLCLVFLKEARLKGKMGPQKVYKALWSPDEMELFKKGEYDPAKDIYADGAVTGDMPALATDEKPADEQLTADTCQGRILVEQKGKPASTHELTKNEMVIGRSSKVDIVLPEQFVSRRHARVIIKEGKYFMEDLGSKMSVLHKGEKIYRHEMKNGDEFLIGPVKLTFQSLAMDQPDIRAQDDPDATIAFSLSRLFQIVVEENGAIIARNDLSDTPLIIGRTADCDITLAQPVVSRKHAKIYLENGAVFIEDLKANNGTFVNGGKIEKTEVTPSDEIRIGPFILHVIDPTISKPDEAHKISGFRNKVFSFLSKK
ncbi:hypothetical protein MNBD_NITROSPINAE04-2222 [hydrothermal vent metagenome]|uniref:Adenylate cyclase n=1 Tax=hydrothermal vent metagenome TaxID=652676 RepID=A0A3B1CAK9_9ZZZZ